MTKRSELVKLFQVYMNDAEDQLESDGFLPGLDVTNKAAAELLNDMLLYWGAAELITTDNDEIVTYTLIDMG